MQEWTGQIKEARAHLSKSFICLIPSEKMRHAFERKLLADLGYYHRVRFMTFYEWILQETEAYRFREQLRMIEPTEQVTWVLHMLEQMDESILSEHQKRIATAEAVVTDLNVIRMHGLDTRLVSGSTKVIFTKLLGAYEDFLKDKRATDYANLLQWMLEEKKTVKDQLVLYPNAGLSLLEKEVCQTYEIRTTTYISNQQSNHVRAIRTYGFGNGVEDALQMIVQEKLQPDQLYLAYAHSDLLRTIYEKIEKHEVPATFADGLAIEWTEVYYFLDRLIQYIDNDQSLHILKELVDGGVFDLGSQKMKLVFNRVLSMKGMTTGKRLLSILRHELDQVGMNPYVEEYEAEVQDIYERMESFHGILEKMKGTSISNLEGIRAILQGFFRVRSEKEGQAKALVVNHLAEMMAYTNESKSILLRDLLDMLAGQRFAVEAEKHGYVHVSSLADVGPLYRAHYCWFGMTTEEFYQKNYSAFLDNKKLEAYDIQTEEERLSQLEVDFENLLMNGGAAHSLYFTTLHMERNQKNNAIPIFDKYEREQGKVSFPIRTLANEKAKDVSLQIEEGAIDVPVYAEGEEGDSYTFSPTSAQTFVKCTRKFMYESIMQLRDQELEAAEKRFWLTPNLRGDLYHDLLEQYMKESQAGEVDAQSLLDDIFMKYEHLYPAIYERQIQTEKKKAQEMLENFIDKLDPNWQVLATEESFGLDDQEALSITLPGEIPVQIRARRKIDRVDYHAEQDAYRVVDYKTGNKTNVNPLQIKLYEKAYQTKHKMEDHSFTNESYFDFILQDERKYADQEDTSLQEFVDQLPRFAREWDEIDYDEVKKSLCNYCSFQYTCAIREANKVDD